MAPPSGSSNKRYTVYELCKKKIELRNRFQTLQSQTNSTDFELRISAQQNWLSPNESSNVCEVRQQYVESQQRKMDDIKVELPSASMTNKSEFCSENISSFLEKVPIVDQFLSEESYSKFNKSTETNSWLKMKLVVCSICYAQFENKTELVQHVKETHMKKRGRPAMPVECNLCQMKFACKKDYVIHFRTHSNKTYICPSCKKMCFYNASHTCKNKKYEKPRHSVWDACKKVLTEKSSQQVSSANSEFVPKLPISKKNVLFKAPQNKVRFKKFKPPSNKKVAKFRPLLKKNEIINPSSLNRISCVQDSVTSQLFAEFKNLDDLQSHNRMSFETETMNLVKIDDTKFLCNTCGMSFKEIEKYEAHYSIHLDEEFCQIREGDEELHVCYVCGGCFTEMNAFQTHKLTHVDKEWPDIKKLD